MQREFPDRPYIGVGAVVVDGGRVLVVRRDREPLRGQWSLPGGVLELGERLRDGVAREVREETGLLVEAGEVLDVFDSIFTDPDGRTRYHYVLIDFLCRVTGGQLRAASDVSDARWATVAELDALDLTPSAAQVIRKALGRGDVYREKH